MFQNTVDVPELAPHITKPPQLLTRSFHCHSTSVFPCTTPALPGFKLQFDLQQLQTGQFTFPRSVKRSLPCEIADSGTQIETTLFNTSPSSNNARSINAQFQDMDERERERQAHLQLIKTAKADGYGSVAEQGLLHAIKSTPIFSRRVRLVLEHGEILGQDLPADRFFPQYGFLGLREATFGPHGEPDCSHPSEVRDQDLIYSNINSPWSAFICGSQGSGKSHTLSCLLENALLKSDACVLPNPLAGIMFHYDNFTSGETTQVCEAAYLCSLGIPVRVLVSPVNLPNMRRLYANLPGLPANAPKPQVEPLHFREQQLNIGNMLILMAVDDGARTPLYMDVIKSILKEMALKDGGAPGIDYREFKKKIGEQNFTRDQIIPLNMRLQLLEDFLKESADMEGIWSFREGTLTIVDLSCPFISQNDACALFTICLGLFMEGRSKAGRIVALDEAHKFLTKSSEAIAFTEQLVSAIRQQRHIASRVLIATQEPTLSPKLLELCNVSIVHRFSSPAWLESLKAHLAALGSIKNDKSASEELFRTIVSQRTGQALLFSPEAILDVVKMESGLLASQQMVRELKDSYIQIRIRQRVTADGGRSILACDMVREVQSYNRYSESRSSPGGSSLEGTDFGKSGSSESPSRDNASENSDLRGGTGVSVGKQNDSNPAPSNLLARPKHQTKRETSMSTTLPTPAESAPALSRPCRPTVPEGWGAVYSDRSQKWYYVNTQWGKPTKPAKGNVPAKSAPLAATGQGSKEALEASRVKECLQRHVVHAMQRKIAIVDFSVIRKAAENELKMRRKSINRRICSTIVKETVTKYINEHGMTPPPWVNWLHR